VRAHAGTYTVSPVKVFLRSAVDVTLPRAPLAVRKQRLAFEELLVGLYAVARIEDGQAATFHMPASTERRPKLLAERAQSLPQTSSCCLASAPGPTVKAL
jgi:hypothetical protein